MTVYMACVLVTLLLALTLVEARPPQDNPTQIPKWRKANIESIDPYFYLALISGNVCKIPNFGFECDRYTCPQVLTLDVLGAQTILIYCRSFKWCDMLRVNNTAGNYGPCVSWRESCVKDFHSRLGAIRMDTLLCIFDARTCEHASVDDKRIFCKWKECVCPRPEPSTTIEVVRARYIKCLADARECLNARSINNTSSCTDGLLVCFKDIYVRYYWEA
ncbi:uncharacterized protein LOC116601412 [Nematostella vectensis]|uniref:uncharacterized protein LOC116601412 n=1 Tax=Nematostella vectensis TaxID=45351 RepID=UPI00138FAAAD|nr:uncharacterized protein LOC116601412 [Nematostella vectensis]